MEIKKIGVYVGSLRKESFSKKTAKVLAQMAPSSIELEIVDLADLEMFNQDFDDGGRTPVSWTNFRERTGKFDAFLFVTPEYNRSVPAVLKNAIDIGSRPYGHSVWNGKPAAVISVSPGLLGGFGANNHLRQTLMFLNIAVMAQPEAYIANAATLFDEKGALINDNSREFLQKFMNSFEEWVNTHSLIR